MTHITINVTDDRVEILGATDVPITLLAGDTLDMGGLKEGDTMYLDLSEMSKPVRIKKTWWGKFRVKVGI